MTSHGDENISNPLLPNMGSGDGGDPAGLPGIGPGDGGGGARGRLSGGFLLLALVLAIAGGMLFAMRKFALGGKLEFVEIKIDYPLETIGRSGARSAEHRQALYDLSASDAVVQIPLSRLSRNPFELEDAPRPSDTPAADAGLEESERIRMEQEARAREVQMTFEALELNSVVTGAVPVARISGQAVRVGDTIADLFTIVAIHGRSVDLVSADAPGRTFTLHLSEPGQSGVGPRPKRRP